MFQTRLTMAAVAKMGFVAWVVAGSLLAFQSAVAQEGVPVDPVPASAAGAELVSGESRVLSHFRGITAFDEWQQERIEADRPGSVLVSPDLVVPFAFDELILSWNVRIQAGTQIKLEARAVYPQRRTKYFVLGLWSTAATHGVLRQSVPGQKDADGDVLTDTLVLSQPCDRLQVRVTLTGPTTGAEPGSLPSSLEFLGICCLDSRARPDTRAVRPTAWGKTLAVPYRSQLTHAELGGKVWCSPTSVSMVLAYWAERLGRAELDVDVPTVAKAVDDPKWPGTGNWPFNTAFVGAFPGIRAYVDRLDDLASLESWIARGVPVVASVVRPLLEGKQPGQVGGHLVVCVGFSGNGDVLIHDPWADPSQLSQVRRVISRADFARAWRRSKHAVYLIYPAAMDQAVGNSAKSEVAAEKPAHKPEPSDEAKVDDATEFVRLLRDEERQPTALQTAVTRYVPNDSRRPTLVVDLVAAVHVGDKAYFEELNKLFKSYDAVLFELVAPKGTKIKPGQPSTSSNPISVFQRVLRDVLDLDFQLERIDYSKSNMVHADMTPRQFAQSMKDRGESFIQMFLRMFKHAMAAERRKPSAGTSDMQLLFALFRADRSLHLKRIMAEQFEDMEDQLAGLNGPDGSTIITERNKIALEELKKQIESGKRRLAIFYGAGHLPDMESRLRTDFGLKIASQKWLTAWSLVAVSEDASSDASSDAKAGDTRTPVTVSE